MNVTQLNWLAIAAATLSACVIGGLWYSKLLFGDIWMKASGMNEEKVKKANPAKTYSVAFVFILIAAVNLGLFMSGPQIGLLQGAFYGFLTGLGWVFTGIGVVALFEQKSWSYIFINGGFWVVALTVMGMIVGAWK